MVCKGKFELDKWLHIFWNFAKMLNQKMQMTLFFMWRNIPSSILFVKTAVIGNSKVRWSYPCTRSQLKFSKQHLPHFLYIRFCWLNCDNLLCHSFSSKWRLTVITFECFTHWIMHISNIPAQLKIDFKRLFTYKSSTFFKDHTWIDGFLACLILW